MNSAKKLVNPGPAQPPPTAAANAVRPAWFNMAERYAREGFLNEPLFHVIVELERLEAEHSRTPVYNGVKYVLERLVAAVLILLLSPVFVVTSIAIALTSRGPVFFTQVRYGMYGAPFRIIKFRTMVPDAEQRIGFIQNESTGGLFKNQSDTRITPLGSLLRRWSVDELPQLLNILKGEMSLIGPRPLPASDSATISPEHYTRFAVRPGITGMWQVYARETSDGRKKIAMDVDYVRRRSFALDLKLLVLTVPRVLSGRGAY